MGKSDRKRATCTRPEARLVGNASGRVLIYAGLETCLELLEGAPGARYLPASQLKLENAPEVAAWLSLPLTRTSLLLLETVGKLVSTSDKYRAVRAELLAANMEAAHLYPEPPEGLPKPFPHQVECFSEAAVALARGDKGYGNFMEMGLGKSRWAADFLRGLRPKVALVLIQKITRFQWECCIRNAYPEATFVPLFDTIEKRKATIRQLAKALDSGDETGPVVLLLNWDVLYRLEPELTKLKGHLEAIVGDEITKIKNRTSQVSKAARKLARFAPVRIPMTGTPMTGDPGDLWAIFQFQDETVFPESYWSFMQKFCVLGGWSGYDFVELRSARVPELIETIYSSAYRQTKATITRMPEISYSVVRLPIKGEQKKHYDKVAKDYATSIEGVGELVVTSVVAQMTRLAQIAAGIVPLTTLTIGDGEEAEVYGGGHREINSAKTEWVVEYCKEQNETSDCRGVIWTRFQAEADRVQKALVEAEVRAEVIDGRTPDKARAAILEEFSDVGSGLRWLVVNISAGAYGLDLPIADMMIYHSSSFAILERLQSEARGHRIGRVRPYQVLDLITEGTIDEEIYDAYQRRLDLIATIVNKGIAA